MEVTKQSVAWKVYSMSNYYLTISEREGLR